MQCSGGAVRSLRVRAYVSTAIARPRHRQVRPRQRARPAATAAMPKALLPRKATKNAATRCRRFLQTSPKSCVAREIQRRENG